MRRRSYQLESQSVPKYKYSFNDKTFDLSLSTSLDNKIGATRAKPLLLQDQIKSKSNFTLDKLLAKNRLQPLAKTDPKAVKNQLKLPSLRKRQILNPEMRRPSAASVTSNHYYTPRVAKAIETNKDTNYLNSLARQHFLQTIQAIRVGKNIHLPNPVRQIKLSKKNPKLKTVFLDLDETLIHCDETSTNYTVKLDFPIEGGSTIAAGVRVRPHCLEFLKELSTFAEIIIFTASSASYADVVLDYLDPQKKYISHRLYRQHCTLQKGFYTKDLRCVNRRLQDAVLVDNSGFCFMMQPENGIPILPYYHYNKDRQLLTLLDFLREVLSSQDVREKLKKHFFLYKFVGEGDPRKIFSENYRPPTTTI